MAVTLAAVRQWTAKRVGLFQGLLGVAVEEAASCVPGVGLAIKIVGEVAKYGLDRLADPRADVPDLKPAGQALPAAQLEQIETWLGSLAQSYGGLLDKLDRLPVTGQEPLKELTARVQQALLGQAELAREFDACAREVRRQTFSLARIEDQLDEAFHQQARVAASLEDLKGMLVNSPLLADWARFRQAQPDAVAAVAQADQLFLAGRRQEAVKSLLGLLQKRGVGTETLCHHLGLQLLGRGQVADARKYLEQARGADGQLPPAVARTLGVVATAAGRDGVAVWRALPRGFDVQKRYRVEAEIGRGGMASVYRAVGSNRLNRGQVVALKVPAPGLMTDDQTCERFVQEIEVSRRLSLGRHPHIVQTLDYVIFDDPHGGSELYGLVMEYVEGQNLADLLAQRRTAQQPLPLAEIRRILQQVGAALTFAHGQAPPVLHRDVKPANVMVTADGTAKLMDFGIARVLEDCRSTLTRTGGVVGTPAYMPPEMYDAQNEIDARSDVYLLGKLLVELLTGSPTGNPAKRPDCPKPWLRLIGEATNQIPDFRPESVAVFLGRLEEEPNPPGPPSLKGKGGDQIGNVAEVSTTSPVRSPPFPLREGGPGGLGPLTPDGDVRLELEPVPPPPPPSNRKLLELVEAAKVLGMTPDELRRLAVGASSRPIPARPFRDGPTFRFRTAEIEEWARERQRPPRELVVDAAGKAQFRTIAAAINEAAPGAVIRIRPGTYAEGLRVSKPLTLQGDGPREKIVVTNATGDALYAEADGIQVRGLTLTCGAQGEDYSGVDVAAGKPVLEDCAITSRSQACVAVHGPDTGAQLHRCTISKGAGIGVFFYEGAQGTLADCQMEENGRFGVVVCQEADVTLRQCHVRKNGRAGVWVYEKGAALLEGCTVGENGKDGGRVQEGGRLKLVRCQVNGNRGHALGAADGASVVAEGCDLRNNDLASIGSAPGATVVNQGCQVDYGHGEEVDFEIPLDSDDGAFELTLDDGPLDEDGGSDVILADDE